VVVDTNVAIAANGRETHAELQCQLACVRRLRDIAFWDRVALDNAGRIFDEYKRHLNWRSQPGVGGQFFKFLVDHQHRADKVLRMAITPDGEEQGFEELPPSRLDPSDRKFLAVACVARATVISATDSDWEEQRELLGQLEVALQQLCPQHATRQP